MGSGDAGADQSGILSEADAFKAIESSILVAATPGAGASQLDAAAMIVALGYVDRKSARTVLVRLSQVYLGEANAEATHSALTMQGKKIRSSLTKALEGAVGCEALKEPTPAIANAIKSLHCVSKEEYSAFIRAVIGDIDAGRAVPYAL